MLNLETFILAFLVFSLAGLTKGLIGFGVNIITIPIMALVLGGTTGAQEAVEIASLVTFLNNVILVAQWREDSYWPQVKRIFPMLGFGVIGVIIGSVLLVKLNAHLITLILGLFTVLYVLTDRARKNWYIAPQQEKTLGPVFGFSSGLLSGVSGVATPILVAYLHNIKLTQREFVYVISVIFILYNGLQSLSYWGLGLYTFDVVIYSVAMLVPVMLGTYTGLRLQSKVSPIWFNRLILLALLITGLDLIRRVVFA